MPSTRLSDVIDIELYNDLPPVDSMEKVAIDESGIMTQGALFDSMANGPGYTGTMPFWRDLDGNSEPNVSNDNPADRATPDKVTQGEMSYRKALLNKAYSVMDLVSELAMGENATRHIKSRLEKYYQRQRQRRIIATARGIMASNIANDGGDMVWDATVATDASARVFTRGNFNAAIGTLGDAAGTIRAIGVHSATMKRIRDSGDIITIRPQDGSIEIPTYQGMVLIEDDNVPIDTTAGTTVAILFGASAFAFGDGTPAVPVGIQRDELAGGGGGEESLVVRKSWIIQPFGFKTNDIAPASGVSYTLPELAMANKWTRVVDRKNVPMAFLLTNI
jgi:hypothetical protein